MTCHQCYCWCDLSCSMSIWLGAKWPLLFPASSVTTGVPKTNWNLKNNNFKGWKLCFLCSNLLYNRKESIHTTFTFNFPWMCCDLNLPWHYIFSTIPVLLGETTVLEDLGSLYCAICQWISRILARDRNNWWKLLNHLAHSPKPD